MAKITAEFDTSDKSLTVAVDGKPVADVTDVYFMKKYGFDEEDDGDDFQACVTTSSEDEATGIRMMTRLCASESIDGKETVARKGPCDSPLPGFVVAGSQNSLSRDIASYFGVK